MTIAVGLGEAADRLETAVESVSPVVAALIPFGALFGAVFLILLLVGMGYQWVDDLRNDGPKRRKFACLYERMESVLGLLVRLGTRSSSGRMLRDGAEFYEVTGEVEVLAGKLKALEIPTPPGLELNLQSVNEWENYVAIMKSYARDGNYQYAMNHGLDLYGRGNASPAS